MQRFVDAEEARLEQAAAVAQAHALSTERWGYIVAGAIAIGGIMAWYLSVPLAIVVYMLMTKGPHRAMEAADKALASYRDTMPATTGY